MERLAPQPRQAALHNSHEGRTLTKARCAAWPRSPRNLARANEKTSWIVPGTAGTLPIEFQGCSFTSRLSSPYSQRQHRQFHASRSMKRDGTTRLTSAGKQAAHEAKPIRRFGHQPSTGRWLEWPSFRTRRVSGPAGRRAMRRCVYCRCDGRASGRPRLVHQSPSCPSR